MNLKKKIKKAIYIFAMFIHKNENKSMRQKKKVLLSIIAILKSKTTQADYKRRSPTITINVYSQGYYNQISSLISKYNIYER